MKDYMTVKEYAEKLGCSIRNVQRLLKDERIPGAKKMGRDWIIPANVWPTPGEKGPLSEWEKRLARNDGSEGD